MRGRTCRLLLLAITLQLSTAAAFAVTGVDACYRPDGVGDESTASASAATAEEGETVEGGSAVIVTMPDGSGDAFDASADFGE
jgi:hypothetical protein